MDFGNMKYSTKKSNLTNRYKTLLVRGSW